LLITFPASHTLFIGFSPEWALRARGDEGTLVPSRRAPQGHDQILGVFAKNPTCDTISVASEILADLRLPQVGKNKKIM